MPPDDTADGDEMAVERHVRRTGNSLGVYIPRLMFESVGLSQDDPVVVARRRDDGVLEIRPRDGSEQDDPDEIEADD